jgi:tripartite-type tricarboxylate transporter receptor subunit TctC
MGPAGLPQPVVDKVRAEALKVLVDPEMQRKVAALGLDTVGSTPEETRAAIAGDIPKWAKVIKDANIKPGQ